MSVDAKTPATVSVVAIYSCICTDVHSRLIAKEEFRSSLFMSSILLSCEIVSLTYRLGSLIRKNARKEVPLDVWALAIYNIKYRFVCSFVFVSVYQFGKELWALRIGWLKRALDQFSEKIWSFDLLLLLLYCLRFSTQKSFRIIFYSRWTDDCFLCGANYDHQPFRLIRKSTMAVKLVMASSSSGLHVIEMLNDGWLVNSAIDRLFLVL